MGKAVGSHLDYYFHGLSASALRRADRPRPVQQPVLRLLVDRFDLLERAQGWLVNMRQTDYNATTIDTGTG